MHASPEVTKSDLRSTLSRGARLLREEVDKRNEIQIISLFLKGFSIRQTKKSVLACLRIK